jgi:hypothetical protein
MCQLFRNFSNGANYAIDLIINHLRENIDYYTSIRLFQEECQY